MNEGSNADTESKVDSAPKGRPPTRWPPGPNQKHVQLPMALPGSSTMTSSAEDGLPPSTYTDLTSETTFNDYLSAPLWTANIPPLSNIWTFNASSALLLPNFATNWKDRGYCLLSNFASLSELQAQAPVDFVAHLLPTDLNGPEETGQGCKDKVAPEGADSDESSSELMAALLERMK